MTEHRESWRGDADMVTEEPTARRDLEWSSWFPLRGIGRNRVVSDRPGLYRIRSVETRRILYVGQTGRSLRARLGSLRGIYGELMPYNDPHTVGPALWAHRIDTGETFEASFVVLEVEKADRMGREALEITKRRIIDGVSPHTTSDECHMDESSRAGTTGGSSRLANGSAGDG